MPSRAHFRTQVCCNFHVRVSWFCSLKGNEFFAEVEHDFMQDDFNLTGLSAQVPYYEYALDTILDAESATAAKFSKDQQEAVESAAELLYGLIHARYIITPRGMAAMLEKYKAVQFGRCPRVHCQGQPALPVGQSDLPRMHTTKIFCCRCEDIYYPRSSRQANVDGAYFGTTFCHLFMQSYAELRPTPSGSLYVPRIFGFKIHRPDGPVLSSCGRAAAVKSGDRDSCGAAEAAAVAAGARAVPARAGAAATGAVAGAASGEAVVGYGSSSRATEGDIFMWKRRQSSELLQSPLPSDAPRTLVPGLQEDEI